MFSTRSPKFLYPMLALLLFASPAFAQRPIFSTGSPAISLPNANTLAVTLPLVNSGTSVASGVSVSSVNLAGARLAFPTSLPTAPADLAAGASTTFVVAFDTSKLTLGTSYLLTVRGTYGTGKPLGFTVNRWVKVPMAITTGTVLQPNVVVLPSDGSVTISNLTPTSVTLSGSLPRLIPGEVIVSGQGYGLLRKVVSVVPSGNSETIQTASASLSDVFQEAQINLTKTFAPSDYASITPTAPGVTVTTGDPSAIASVSAASPRTARPSAVPLASGPSSIINFANVEVTPVSATGSISLTGSASISLSIDLEIDVDWTGIHSVRCVPTVTGAADVKAHAEATVNLPAVKFKIINIPVKPFVFYVSAGIIPLPVPIVVTPNIDLYTTADGQIEAGVDVESKGSISVGAGVQYTSDAGWSLVESYKPDLNIIPTITSYTSATCHVTPVNADVSFLIYGVVGPFINVDLPKFTSVLQVKSSPLSGTFSVYADFDGMVGFKVDLLGFKKDYSTSFDKQFLLYQKNLFSRDVYVTGSDTFQVSVVDSVTNAVKDQIDVPGGMYDLLGYFPESIAIAPDGKRAYVVDSTGGNGDRLVTVIDTSTKTVIANIPVGYDGSNGVQAHEIAVSPDGTKVYVTTGAVIDTTSNTVLSSITPFNNGFTLAPNGKTLYDGSGTGFINPPVDGMSVGPVLDARNLATSVDTLTGIIDPAIPAYAEIFFGAPALAVTQDGSKVYFLEDRSEGQYDILYNRDAVAVIDPFTGLVNFIDMGYSDPLDVAVSPDGNSIYVLCGNGGVNTGASLYVIDGSSDVINAIINLSQGSLTGDGALVVSPDGKKVYVEPYGAVIDTATNTVVANIVGGIAVAVN